MFSQSWSLRLLSQNLENYNKEQRQMPEYNIIKIIDGLFVSDQPVTLDVIFLGSNKIIKILGWTAIPAEHQFQSNETEYYQLQKNVKQVKFPPFQQLQQGFNFLEAVHEQMLCGLIYSQSAIEAALICIMYLMRKFRWDCNTAFSYLRSKMEIFQFSDQTLDQLQNYESDLRNKLKLKLSRILWEYQFLQNYQPCSEEQTIIITTLKNRLRRTQKYHFQPRQKVKKATRVKWSDQLRPSIKPSSAFLISSAKNLPKNSHLKGHLVSPANATSIITPVLQDLSNSKDLQLLYQSPGFKNSLNKKSQNEKKKKKANFWDDNTQYLELKCMSRTNFNDYRNFSKQMKRRESLKPKQKQQNLQKSSSSSSIQSINKLINIYSHKGMNGKRLLPKSSSAQNFLSGLQSFNRVVNNA